MRTQFPIPHRMPARTLGTSIAALLVLVPLSRAQETDSVILRDGNTELGKILAEDYAGVSFQPEQGSKKVVAWDDVRALDYFDAPEELTSGLATLAAGNAEAALELLEIVIATEGLRPMIAQQASFHAAFAEQRLGRTKQAIERYEKLLATAPKGRYLRMVGENLLDLHLLTGNVQGARAALDKLIQGAQGLEGGEPLVQLLEGRLLELQGKFAEAAERYGAAEGLAGPPAILQEGKLGRARMLLRQNKAAEAEALLRALIAESASSRVQSGAWNGVGEIQSTEGRAKKDGERILEGLYAYLRTVVQYKPLPGESTEEYERALLGASTCFEYLSQLEQNPERKKLLRERHRDRLEQLQREYPASIFLKK